MTEERHQPPSSKDSPALDSEIGFRGIFIFTAGLLVLVALAAVGMWVLATNLRDVQVAQEPPPPALPEARLPYEPPGPRLQSDPTQEIRQMQTEEDYELTTFGWVDKQANVARIPVERAMELLVERGLPKPPDEPASGRTPETPDRNSKAGD